MFSKGVVAVVVVHPIMWKLVLVVSKGVFVDCMCRYGDERPTGVWYWIPFLASSERQSGGGLSLQWIICFSGTPGDRYTLLISSQWVSWVRLSFAELEMSGWN